MEKSNLFGFMKLSSKNLKLKYSKQKSFNVNHRISFLGEQKNKLNQKMMGKRFSHNDNNNNNYHRKISVQSMRKKNSIQLTINFKNIEEDIKSTLLEMKRTFLFESRCQSIDYENKNANIKSEIEKNNRMNKYKSKHTDENNINKKPLKSKTFKSDNSKRNFKKTIDDNQNNKDDMKNKKKKFEKRISKEKNLRTKSIIPEEKFRFIARGGIIIDSQNENESDEEKFEGRFLINPETKFVFIYDALITFITLYYLIYVPIELIKNFCFCNSNNSFFNILINSIFEIIFIIDIIVEFFRGFYTNEEEILVKNNIRIINNYITGWFLFDLLFSLPIDMLFLYFCKKYPNKICFSYQNNKLMDFLILTRCLKSLKIIKITTRKKNQFITKVLDKCSDSEILDLLIKILFVYFGLHIVSCIHIFIGKHIYPGWIFKNEFQNYSLLNIYMISIYYLITTMTTVGYGEIQSDSLIEIVFRIILLAVGIICYSWLISSISNGINKQSFASINFSNECLLLESIRRAHRELPYKVYFEIKKYLECKHFKQNNYDKDFLINSLPYSLKNNLIFSMYKYQIEKFHFFKGISNSNFLVETLSYLTPVTGKRNDTFINENEIVEEMYFVQEGRLALEVPINVDRPDESVNKYLSDEFLSFAFDFDFEANYNQLPDISQFETSNNMDDDNIGLNTLKNAGFINSLILKKENVKQKKVEINIYLKIHDIHKNEDFGDIYMFFGKRTPFALIAKSKRVTLYSIKKDNYANLCEEYHNVFRRIHKKKKHNYKIIKNIFIKTISKFCDIKGIKIKPNYQSTINKAFRDMQRELIPTEILLSVHNIDINEIDEQINKTLKDFEREMNFKKTEVKKVKKKKLFGNFLRNHKTMDETYSHNKKFTGTYVNNVEKNIFLENSKIKSDFRHFNSINGNNTLNFGKNKKKKLLNGKSKCKKKNKMKTNIKTNITSNLNLKGYNFDYSDNEESVKTEKIYDKNNQSFESGPKTIKTLPKSLVDLLKDKIKKKKLSSKNNISNINEKITIIQKDNDISNANEKISIISKNNDNNLTLNDSNLNCINNLLNIKNRNKKNDIKLKQKETTLSCLSYDKLISKNDKEEKAGKDSNELNNINSKIQKNNSPKKSSKDKNKRLSISKRNIIKKTKSPRETLSPKTNNQNNIISYNQYNNYERCSITNNNILVKLGENILNKNNSFNIDNLSTDSVESFQINNSYTNLNEITDGVYMKEKKFQMDTIQFVKEYKNKNNKNKTNKIKEKKTDSSSSFEFERGKTKKSVGNILSIKNNIKTVKTRMSQYLNQQIKFMKKKTLNAKRKSIAIKNIQNEKSKKDFSINNSINSSNNSLKKHQKNLNNNGSYNENTIVKENNINEIENKIVNKLDDSLK